MAAQAASNWAWSMRAPHQLHPQQQEVGLDDVLAAVLVDLRQPAGLPEVLHHGTVDIALAAQADELAQEVEAAADAVDAVVADEVVEVVVAFFRIPVTVPEPLVEVARRPAGVLERVELQHRQVEVAAVERNQRAVEPLHPLPEVTDDGLLAVVVGPQGLNVHQHGIAVHDAHRDGDRDMEGDGKKVAAALRDPLGPEPLIGLPVGDVLLGGVHRLHQALVDAGLDIEDGVGHGAVKETLTMGRCRSWRPSTSLRWRSATLRTNGEWSHDGSSRALRRAQEQTGE